MSEVATDDTQSSSALVPWRIVETNADWLTVVVNVSFDLRAGALARPTAARPIADDDRVPCKPYAEVVLLGQTRAPRAHVVGVGVARGHTILLQKRLVAPGGGEAVDINAGALMDASDCTRHDRFLAAASATLPQAADGALLVSLMDDLRKVQRTAPDQWLPELGGGERVRLTGFEGGDIDTRLPDLLPRANIVGIGPVPLACDTLELDGTCAMATLTFRGAVLKRHRPVGALTVVLGPRPGGGGAIGSPRSWAKSRRVAPSPAVDVVEVADRSGFACWTMRWSPFPDELRRVLIVKGTFDIASDGASLSPSPEQAPLEPERPAADKTGITRGSDFAPVKPLVDIIVHAQAYGGAGKTAVPIAVEVGDVAVELVAMGPRQFQSQGIPGAPGELDTLPLSWGYAFGGPEVLENPLGTGAAPGSAPPRIEGTAELMKSFGDRPSPAGVAAIPTSWLLRTRLLGTFDGAWERGRWPHMPGDFDPCYYQDAAPELRATELAPGARVRLTNVREGGAPISFSLPKLSPRAYLFRPGAEPELLSLRLDTLTIDVEQSKVFLLWRGSYPIARRGRPPERIHLVREDVSRPFSPEANAAMLAVARLPDWEERVAPVGGAASVDVTKILERFMALARSEARARARDEKSAPAPLDAPAVAELLREGGSLRGRDLTRARLDGAVLRDVDLRGAILRGASLTGAHLEGADLEGAVLAQARGADAHFDGANLRRADLANADLSGASFRGARVDYASFARATLAASDLGGATGLSASFVGAQLANALVDEAKLPKADFTDAVLTDASLCKAELRGATFQETDVSRARFDGGTLENARFELATGRGSSFERVKASGSTWDGADLAEVDFSGAELSSAVFGATTLTSASFDGASAEGARFREADLSGSRLRGAHLKGASFESACLDGASFERANLDEANLTTASLVGTNLDRAFLETAIPRAPP